MDQQPQHRTNVYTFDRHMLITASVVAVIVFIFLLVTLHLYTRWWLRNGPVSHFFVVTEHNPPSASDHGLESNILSSLPVFTYSSSTAAESPELECAVCLSEFKENEIGRLLPKCNHSFHIECIDMWFHSHSTCPLCRSLVEAVAEVNEPGDSELCDKCQHEETAMSQSSELDLECGFRETVRVSTPK